MLKNYLKVAYRNILKNKGTTLINAFGMALAIGCCMLVYELQNHIYNADAFHSNRDEIYVVQREMDLNGDISVWNDVPQELGVALKNDFHQIKTMVRVNNRRGIIKYDDKVFNQGIAFVDDAYYDLFDFPVKWGEPTTFTDAESIVLSDYVSQKYFGDQNPIGEVLTILFTENGEEIAIPFTVKGVLENPPNNASYFDDILVPFDRQKIFGTTEAEWTQLSNPTFIQVKNEKALASIKELESKYLAIINEANDQWKMVSIYFQPFGTIMETGYKVRNNRFNGFVAEGILMISAIGFFLLLMACFNYLNIALAAAATRLKEISVRKVLGSTRRQIIIQFLTEHFLICFGALLLGIFLAHQVFLPWFNNSMGGGDNLSLTYLTNPTIWLFSIGLLIFVILASAGYPAFYISKYQPVAIMKKEFRVGSKSGFQKCLIGGQLFLSVLTIYTAYGGLYLNEQIRNKDWGYNQNGVGIIQLEDSKDFEVFKQEIATHPNIIAVTGSQEVIGRGVQTLKTQVTGKEYEVEGMTVAANYLSVLEVPLIAGRYFDAQKETDKTEAILVNESFSKMMNWKNAVGKSIKLANQPFQIIGEVKDVHQNDFIKKVPPMVFKTGESDQFSYVSIRAQSGMAVSTIQALNTNWKKLYPNAPYSYFFQDNAFWSYFNLFEQIAAILSGAAFMTLWICIIGLFGLAMLLTNRKMKEISIRKILGANKLQIIHLVQKDFFIPLVIALIFALPLAYSIMQSLKNQFASSISISIVPALLTIGSIVLMVLFSLSKHIYTALHSEPSDFLRDE